MCIIFGARVTSGKLQLKKIIKQVQDFSNKNDIVIQLFNADFIFGKDHLYTAYKHAKRAFDQDKAIAKTLDMEILLYVAGEYQIKNALAKVGISENTTNLAFILVGSGEIQEEKIDNLLNALSSNDLKLERDDDVLTGDKDVLTAFGISEIELEAIPEERWLELVLEKVALLDILK